MFKKVKLFTVTLIFFIAAVQMIGCIPSKNLVKFTGHWVTKQDPYDETKTIRSCVEGGYQCAVLGTGVEVEITNDMIEQMIQ